MNESISEINVFLFIYLSVSYGISPEINYIDHLVYLCFIC